VAAAEAGGRADVRAADPASARRDPHPVGAVAAVGHRDRRAEGGETNMAWMVVRVRGTIHARHDITETLGFLHLTRPNHATVVPELPSMRGMLTAVQGYVTWGEAEPETVELLLKERGETLSGQRLTPESMGDLPAKQDLGQITRAVAEKGLPSAAGLKPLFRLRAPKGGWRSTKKPYALGGALGYRGRAINELVRRMV
jgi:large subunit ribosomal protein L30